MGIHNFELFVRMEIRTKIEEALGGPGVLQWPPTLSLLFFFCFMGAWFFDVLSPPEVSIYHLISLTSMSAGALLIASPAFGFAINLAALAVGLARECCGHMWALALVGSPMVIVAFITMMLVNGLTNPFMILIGSDPPIGQMKFPDDGLDPDSHVQPYVTHCIRPNP